MSDICKFCQKAFVEQLEAWRARWEPSSPDTDALNRAFAAIFASIDGKHVINYLLETYYNPIEFVGPTDWGILAARNGQQKLIIDILTRIGIGTHPHLYQEPESTENPLAADVRT